MLLRLGHAAEDDDGLTAELDRLAIAVEGEEEGVAAARLEPEAGRRLPPGPAGPGAQRPHGSVRPSSWRTLAAARVLATAA